MPMLWIPRYLPSETEGSPMGSPMGRDLDGTGPTPTLSPPEVRFRVRVMRCRYCDRILTAEESRRRGICGTCARELRPIRV